MDARTITMLVVLALSRSATADALELGAYAGRASTSIYTSYECPTTADDCVTLTEPHEGARGASVGASLRYALLPQVLLEGNLLYVQKGYAAYPTVRFHYVEVPFLVRIDPLRGQLPVRLFVYGGIAPAIRVGCHASGSAFDNETRMSYLYSTACADAPFPPTPARFDLGGVGGVGVGWDVSFGTFEVQGRAVRSLVDIDDEGGDTVNDATYVLVGFSRTLAL